MNAGELDNKISILTLASEVSGTETVYTWSVMSQVWAKAETPESYSAFSRIGEGERTAKFTIRKTTLALTNAILWGDKHCFITHIAEVDRMFYEITAALIERKHVRILLIAMRLMH
jgi:head-tail adaptor